MLQGLPGSISTYGSIFRMIEGAEALKRDIKTRPGGLDPFTHFLGLRRKKHRSGFASIEYTGG